MTTVRDIMNAVEAFAPLNTREEWDNSGLNAGSPDSAVTKVLLSLDITPAVADEAADIGTQLIISHHPVIFHPLRSLVKDSAAYLLAKHDISALCLHTNLDRSDPGVNTALAKALGLGNIRLYPQDFIAVGELDTDTPAKAYAAIVKERLKAPSVRYTEGRIIRTVAVSSGGGGEGIALYEKYGFDAFVTGELKHHQFLFAKEHSLSAFDAGHHSTEEVVIEPLRDMLSAALPDITFVISKKNPCPYEAV